MVKLLFGCGKNRFGYGNLVGPLANETEKERLLLLCSSFFVDWAADASVAPVQTQVGYGDLPLMGPTQRIKQ